MVDSSFISCFSYRQEKNKKKDGQKQTDHQEKGAIRRPKVRSTEIDRTLRNRFVRHMVLYPYILMYTPKLIAILLLLSFIFNLVFPQLYNTATSYTDSVLGSLFQPISNPNDVLSLLAKFFGAFAYFCVFTWKWKGQTPGKRYMQIKVVKLNGIFITFWGNLKRATAILLPQLCILWLPSIFLGKRPPDYP